MNRTLLEINNYTYELPDTANLKASDFNSISHSFIKNTSDKLIKKYGNFASDLNFSHDNTVHKVNGRNMLGGVDTKLTCIINFHRNSKSLSNLKDAINRIENDYQRHTQLNWFEDTKSYFQALLAERMRNRKRPLFYTGALKHKKSRRYVANAAFLVIEQHGMLHLYARIGQTEYDFQIKFEEIEVKSGKQIRCDYSVYDAATIGEVDELLAEDISDLSGAMNSRFKVTSNLEIKFEVNKQLNVKAHYIEQELQAVLASLDFDADFQ
ncbi:hypothetical protein BCU85_20755 [Vibrio lentus]|uniref:HAM1-like domain-containing protein n=1 Tax=Vibrio lentus TaxID=136468 RepID=UPI000C8442A9|nr:DUF5923 family protein [Vibrio lentus]MCC4819340.1 DUF5923 family protein [Vibrio lentus]PMG72019.1 hypothetical protein BCU85_20755 [Vibrio lentus]PMK86333.1 hypothetical protein BCT88_12095 [Vibrio lentus]PML21291.1 hypothetical protein BCT80_15680 [Vibrio lentus]PMM24003.1 hypothetical protein BCT57_08395 [Vibrio lentus]